MSILKNYLSTQLCGFEKLLFLDKYEFLISHCRSIGWVISAFFVSCLPKLNLHYLPNIYLENAIIEGIGPHFWNMVATSGFFLIGLFFLFPKFSYFPKWAYKILAGTYTSGMISLGLLIGEIAFTFPDLWSVFDFWRVVLIFFALILSIFLVYGLVYSTFYISRLLISDEIMEQITKMDFRLKFFGFLIFSASPVFFLFMEK
ncbi:hypothetical protein Q5M49_02540 [Acinetobacter nosocomialis]|uniref:hypothetical protein n=1 Tax=Acinetobacter nosocomialis TaxID=106654 RepID=UPI0026EA1427|nr:hypothetical protein [Acinetobacter nosocomialis]MDO7192567.1 hypothetical protein [Acinetobacter nosocomialis]MDO7214302.1 hypothetical protein [Acinetobacter nosocomialis]MDX7934830.1 hypothetical protein [Acinetobacter baumannii]